MAGWETLIDALASDSDRFGGQYLNRLSSLFTGNDIGAVDSTLKPIIGTDWKFRSGNFFLNDSNNDNTIQILPDNQTVNTIAKIPTQSFTPDYIVLRKQSEELENKIIDGTKNTITNLGISGWNPNATETLTNKTISAALNKILQVSQSYYYIFIDTNDGNKFKARNNITGVIDYTSAGSTDATTVIQNAINAAAGLGSVFLSAGSYPVTSGTSPILTIPSNSHIFGPRTAIIASQTTGKCVLANATRSGAGNSNIIIENITINGNWNLTGAHVDDACGILLDYITDGTVKNCKILNTWGEGIKCRNSFRALIQGNYVNSTADGKAGMIIASGSTYGQIIGNIAIDCGGESYSAVDDSTEAGGNIPTNHIVIANNIGYVTYVNPTLNGGMPRGHLLIESIGGNGVFDTVVSNNNIMAGFANALIVSNATGRNLVISNNTLTHFAGQTVFPASPSAAHGISISGHGIDITGNVIHDVMGHGIITSSGNSKINISNNIIRNCALMQVYSTDPSYTGPYDGINNTSTAATLTDNLISNNIIIDESTNMRYGINMAGTAAHTNISIQGNSIRGNQTAPAIVTGAYSTATNIKIANNPGHVSEARGLSATQSGNGSTTVFNIPHGCAAAPNYVDARAVTSDARGTPTLSADATNVIITYPIAPPSGTNNLQWYWSAGTLYS